MKRFAVGELEVERVLAQIYDRAMTPEGQRHVYAEAACLERPEQAVLEVIGATLADRGMIDPAYSQDMVHAWRAALDRRLSEREVMLDFEVEHLRTLATLIDDLLTLAERGFDQTPMAERTPAIVLTLQRGARWAGFLDLVARTAAAFVEVDKTCE